jgi:phage tail sheath protein FI
MPIVQSVAGQILDDVYVIEVPSPLAIQGVQVGIVGLVGTFRQGIPTGIYSISDYPTAVRLLGASAVLIGGPMAIQNLIRQGCGNIQVVPVFGTGAEPASVNLLDGSATPGILGTITAAQAHPQTGVMTPLLGWGPNSWSVAVTQPTTPNGTFNLTINNGSVTESYTGLTPATWAATINAASAIAIVSQPATPSALPAASGNFLLSGGSSGALTTSALQDAAIIGSVGTTGQATGLALLQTLAPDAINLALPAEYSSAAVNAAFANYAETNDAIVSLCATQGSTVATTITQKSLISQDNVAFVDGWTTCYDSDVGANRVCAPNALAIGMAAQLAPQKSWGNKSIYGTQGLVITRSNADMATLQQAGVLCLANKIPRGGFGTRSGVASDGSDLYVRRMRYFLEFSIMDAMGWAVNELQSTQPNDKLRGDITQTINTFLSGLASPTDPALAVIDSFLVTCNLTNNPVAQIAAGKLSVSVKVKLLAAAAMIIISIDASTSTITTTSTVAA